MNDIHAAAVAFAEAGDSMSIAMDGSDETGNCKCGGDCKCKAAE